MQREIYCNTLQHTATKCNTPHHTTTHCNTCMYPCRWYCARWRTVIGGCDERRRLRVQRWRLLATNVSCRCVAVCCSVVRCVAVVCCSWCVVVSCSVVLQRVAGNQCSHLLATSLSCRCVALCCGLVQRGAAWCSVVQCVLHCVAVWCSVVQRGAVCVAVCCRKSVYRISRLLKLMGLFCRISSLL